MALHETFDIAHSRHPHAIACRDFSSHPPHGEAELYARIGSAH